jgi:ligand-binding sensor domain-containing protein
MRALGVVGLALGSLALLSADGPTTGQAQAQTSLPIGEWTTFANGDDVLALQLEGDLLWAGTRGGGLLRWDTQRKTYRQFLRPQDPLGGNRIQDIAIDGLGRKWLATDGGLTVFADQGTADEADDLWYTYLRSNTAGGLPSDDLQAVAVDGDRVWVGGAQTRDAATGAWSGGGLGRLDTGGSPEIEDDTWSGVTTFQSTYSRSPDGSEHVGLVSDTINDLALTQDGRLWVATDPHWWLRPAPDPDEPPIWVQGHGGISHLDTKGTPDDVSDDVWTGNSCLDAELTVTCRVQAIAIDHQGFGWAAIQGRGVLAFDASRGLIPDDPDRRISLPERRIGDVVQAIAFGPAENPSLANTVWLGSSLGGLSVLDHRGTVLLRGDDVWNLGRGAGFNSGDGLARNRIQAIAIGATGAFLGTGPERGTAGGAQRLDLADLTLAAPLLTDRAPPSNFITDIAMGSSGSLWEGQIWIATGSRSQQLLGAGAARLDTSGTADTIDDEWSHFSRLGTDADGRYPWTGLAGDNVQALAIQGDRVWLGSVESLWNQGRKAYDDGGLSVFDGRSWTARTVESTGGADQGLQFGGVTSLAKGCQGDLWIGTGSQAAALGDGVAVLKPGASVHQPTQDSWAHHRFPELASNNTSAIDIDCASGEVWVASAHHRSVADDKGSPSGLLIGGGVARFAVADDRWTVSDTRSGLESFQKGSLRAEALSVAALGDGRALVGTYGTRSTTGQQIIAERPYWPAALNLGAGDSWSNRVFEQGGMLRALAIDGRGRVWAGTSRGGAASESVAPEGWRQDRDMPGLFVFDSPDLSEQPVELSVEHSGIASTDISAIAVAPWDGEEIWIGSEGWGLMRYRAAGTPPTATPALDPPPTPTDGAALATPTPGAPTPTRTPWPPTTTPEATPSPNFGVGGARKLYLPYLSQSAPGRYIDRGRRPKLYCPFVFKGW